MHNGYEEWHEVPHSEVPEQRILPNPPLDSGKLPLPPEAMYSDPPRLFESPSTEGGSWGLDSPFVTSSEVLESYGGVVANRGFF
jgi:hypothetical protein